MKKRCACHIQLLLVAAMVLLVEGCTPAGPRALLDGKRLLEEGKYEPAIERLKMAASLLATNAQVWNYLGLAYHHAGQPANAMEAYQRALKLNHDLAIVHYNLGCLLLEENRRDRLESARNELTAYTLHQGNSIEGWLKLGRVQLHLGEFAAAEKSFNEALRLGPQNPEALNDMGVAQLQRNRHHDAAAYFGAALRQQPAYGPALLNLAVVSQSYLNNRPLALEKYREYLALKPPPANADGVIAAVRQLEQELNPPPRPSNSAPMVAATPAASGPKPSSNGPVRLVPAPGSTAAATAPKSNIITGSPRLLASGPPRPVVQPEPAIKPDVVELPESVVVRPAEDVAPPSRVLGTVNVPARPAAGSTQPSTSEAAPPAKSVKRGFFQRLNPMNVFRREPASTPAPVPTPLPRSVSPLGGGGPDQAESVSTDPKPVSQSPPPQAPPSARYAYQAPPKPVSGDRREAERLFAQGVQAQREHRFRDAVVAYRGATQADPVFFEAQLNLGLAAFDMGDMPQSLAAYETALAINPDAFNARFNFALALKKANYILDAAQELERLLAVPHAGEPPAHVATAQLTLANLYSEEFHQPASARPHYLKVLEVDPQNAQATAIRYWLRDHP